MVDPMTYPEYKRLKEYDDSSDAKLAHIQDPILRAMYGGLSWDMEGVIELGKRVLSDAQDKLAILEAMDKAIENILSDIDEHGEDNTNGYDDEDVRNFEEERKQIALQIDDLRKQGMKSEVFHKHDAAEDAWMDEAARGFLKEIPDDLSEGAYRELLEEAAKDEPSGERVIEVPKKTPCEGFEAGKKLAELMEQEKWKEVVDIASKGIREYPDHIFFYTFIGIAYRKLGDLEASYSMATQGLLSIFDVNQYSLSLINWCITICTLTGRYQEAIDIWMNYKDEIVKPNGTKTALLDSSGGKLDWENALQNTVGCFTLLKKFKDGIRETEKYLASVDGAETNGAVFFNVSGLFSLAGDVEKALFYMEKAIRCGKERESFNRDSDFDPIRELPEFKALLRMHSI